MNAHDREACALPALDNEHLRSDLLNRLKRAEGQLRGIQRMIEGGESCLDIAGQMAAVRKALDSTYAPNDGVFHRTRAAVAPSDW